MGKTFSEEAKQKISKSNIGKKHSEETKQKMRDIRQNISVETKQKMSEAQLGKTRSEETKKKISISKKKLCSGDKNTAFEKTNKIISTISSTNIFW